MFFSFCSFRIEPIAGFTASCSMVDNIVKRKLGIRFYGLGFRGNKRGVLLMLLF